MSLLRNRNYLLLRTGWSASSLGSQMQSFAFSLYVLMITGSAVRFSVTLCMEMLPNILFAPLSGYLGDRFDRKKQVVIYDSLSGLFTLAFWFMAVRGSLPVYAVYLCVFLLSSLQNFFGASAGGLMQAAVDPADYTRQKSVDSTLTNLTALFAPALAGVLYAAGGVQLSLFINALSFFVSAGMECFLRMPKEKRAPGLEASFWPAMREGFSYMRDNPFIRSFLLNLSMLNFILSACIVGLMVVSQQTLHLSPVFIGVESALPSLGAMLGALLSVLLSKRLEKISFHKITAADISLMAVLFFLAGAWLLFLCPVLPLLLNAGILAAFNFITAVINAILSVALNARFVREVPGELMGRVGNFVVAGLTVSVPAGQLAAGAVMGISPAAAYIGEGVLTALMALGNIRHLRVENAEKSVILVSEQEKSGAG